MQEKKSSKPEKKEKIVQVHYWKKLQKEINQVIGDLHGLTILIHNSIKFQDIVEFLNKVRKNDQLTILYISLINSYRRINQTLEQKKLHNKDLHVVDCVSGFIIEVEDTEKCKYRKPPKNLEKLQKMIMNNIARVNPNIVVVDSLSQFINFSTPPEEELNDFYRFLRETKNNILGLDKDSIILLYNDKIGVIRTLPVMNVDQILKLEVIREKVRWKD